VAPSGAPQNKPVGFRFNEELQTIDIGGFQMEHLAKFRNVAVHPQVAFTVDDVADPSAGADGVRFVEIRGVAEQVKLDSRSRPGLGDWIIRIHPRRVVSWNVAGPGLYDADFASGPSDTAGARPALGLTGALAERAHGAVAQQVAEMQAGLGDRDAEDFNRHFAEDVMWGSPYGATVDGYEAARDPPADARNRRPRGIALRDRARVGPDGRRRPGPGQAHRAGRGSAINRAKPNA
jgi:pyridoxamine 5'-phosphate oxidase family protein